MFSAIQNTDSFHELLKQDVMYKLAATYPAEGVIQTQDLITLEEASSDTEPDARADKLSRVLSEIKERNDKVKIEQLKRDEMRKDNADQRLEKLKTQVAPQALNVLY